MWNDYASSEIIEIDQARFAIQGAKDGGPFDTVVGSEQIPECDPQTDIDE